MAAMLGAVPLAIGFGEGSELRRPLGIAIVGGLILSQMLTLYTTPVIYLYIDRFRLWSQGRHTARPPLPRLRFLLGMNGHRGISALLSLKSWGTISS